MIYQRIKQGIFLERPNRFVARVMTDGYPETVHVKNTGRCRELLTPGARVILEDVGHPGRKTRYSLISVYKGDMLINMDSQAPNHVVYEGLQQGLLPGFGSLTRISKEKTYGNSRFDLYYESETAQGFIEVKGVTLERDGTALFPDAPTQRGAKHLLELSEAVHAGYKNYIFFLIQMKGPGLFRPNGNMDPGFEAALRQARENGVGVLAYDTIVTEDSLTLGDAVRVEI